LSLKSLRLDWQLSKKVHATNKQNVRWRTQRK